MFRIASGAAVLAAALALAAPAQALVTYCTGGITAYDYRNTGNRDVNDNSGYNYRSINRMVIQSASGSGRSFSQRLLAKRDGIVTNYSFTENNNTNIAQSPVVNAYLRALCEYNSPSGNRQTFNCEVE